MRVDFLADPADKNYLGQVEGFHRLGGENPGQESAAGGA